MTSNREGIAAICAVVVFTAGLSCYLVFEPPRIVVKSAASAQTPGAVTQASASTVASVKPPASTDSVPTLIGVPGTTHRETATKLAVIGGHLNEYWAQQFVRPVFAGHSWKPIESLYVDTNSKACDGRDEHLFNDYFCPGKYYVELEVTSAERDGVPIATPSRNFIIAHEWGHAVQERATLRADDKTMELQADCFAGAFLRHASDSAILSGGDVDLVALHTAIRAIGDEVLAFVPGSEHGTGDERVASFEAGWLGGPAACIRDGEEAQK